MVNESNESASLLIHRIHPAVYLINVEQCQMTASKLLGMDGSYCMVAGYSLKYHMGTELWAVL